MADTTEGKIKKLITEDQISGLSNTELKNIINTLSTYIARENENNNDFLKHLPILQADFKNGTFSEFERLNNRIDLDNVPTDINPNRLGRDDYINYILNNIENNELWNYSMNELAKEYKKNFKDDNSKIPGSTEDESDNYTPDDIKHANAGRNFADGPEWVRPEKDNMGNFYQDVRDDDKIEEVLKSSKNLQFTRQAKDSVGNILKYYVRLIMPKYTRRVEVEDLNRNFWVIGQTLSGVAAYLFDDESPIKKFMKYSLSELIQLWENIIYLWAAVELLNEKEEEAPEPEPNYGIHYEVIDMPRAYDKPYRDINNFYTGIPKFDNNDEWYYPLRGIAHSYPQNCLCLLIRCRFGNYEKDYYHTEIYPYIVYYNRYEDKWSYTKLKVNGSTVYKCFGFTLRIDSETAEDGLYNYLNLRQYVYGLKEDEPNDYYHYFPLQTMPPRNGYKSGNTTYYGPNDPSGKHHYYYGIVQIKPTIYAKVSNKKIYVTTLKFEIQDIARRLHYFGQSSLPDYDPEHPDRSDVPAKDQFVDDGRNSIEYYKYSFAPINSDTTNSYSEDTATININNPLGTVIKPTYVYNGTTYSIPQGFIDKNERDSGFQGSLCDMLTYRGVSNGT